MTGGANHSRLVSMTYPVSPSYPQGRVLHYGYNTGLDNSISRLSFQADDDGMGGVGTHLEEYSYLGLGTVVQRLHPQSLVDLTYIGTPADGGDQYAGLDRFGRVVDQHWIPSANPSMPTDRYQYSYDRDSNRQFCDNLVSAVFAELYHPRGVVDTYDGAGNLLTTGYDLLTGCDRSIPRGYAAICIVFSAAPCEVSIRGRVFELMWDS